jgi:hypothetical protein
VAAGVDRRARPRPHGLRDLIGGSRLLWIALGVVVVALSIVRIVGYTAFLERREIFDSDFPADYVSAREWREGGDPYAPIPDLTRKHLGPGSDTRLGYEAGQRNPHPPALVVIQAPLASTDVEVARAIFMALMLLATFLALLLFTLEIGLKRLTAAVVSFGALALPIIGFEMRWGQINGLLLLMLVLGWRDLRRGRDLRAGLWLGLATALKVFPWMLIIPLVRAKRMKAAGWMLASSIGFTIAGVAALGLEATRTFLTVAMPENVEIWGAAPHSISLVTLPFRLFAADRWLDPSVAIAPWVGWLGVLAVAACAVAAWHTSSAVTRDPFWGVVPWIILGTPVAWTHYLVIVLPLAILVVLRSRRVSQPLKAFLAVGCVLFALGPVYLDWLSSVGGFSLQDYGNVVAGTTILMAGLSVIGIADLRGEAGAASGGRRDPDDRVSPQFRDRHVDARPQLLPARDAE